MEKNYYTTENIQLQAKQDYKVNKQLVKQLKKKKPKQFDLLMQKLHEETFEEIDCLQCANCCKSLGPRIRNVDINRMAKVLKIKPSTFVDEYLKIDEDNDYVFKQMPCPMLDNDNYCLVYEARPGACREYPHTDRVNSLQIINLTLKNSETCPAILEIFKKLRQS